MNFRIAVGAVVFALVSGTFGLPGTAESAELDRPEGVVEIPYTKFVLDNGLTLIVHEDHKAPIAAVNVWYDVGSADEKPGRTGFAHLFEHLMFNGSEHYDDDYFKPFDRVGATGMNGTTNTDRTNYFQVVPTTALDMALWMESDRMGHLLEAIDQDKLDEQRGVVQNEKRQGENQPYGKVFFTIMENTFPAGHPYDHSVIGSMEDLNAASLEDVHEWFETYYGAANAVVAVAGDVEPEDVKRRVEKYFGHIPSGPPLVKPDVNVARRSQEARHVIQDRVPQARVYKAWNVAAYGDPDVDYLDLVSDVLTDGKSSRLYKRLVYEDQIATDVSSFNLSRQLGGLFIVWATVQPGGDTARVEEVLEEELTRFLDEGPTAEELDRARTSRRGSFLRGIERVGGFGGKSDVLAASQVYLGSPDAHEESQARILRATPNDVHGTAQRWLSEGAFTLEVRPFPEYSTAESSVDRSRGVPEVAAFPEGEFPDRQEATLTNGMKVIVAERHAVPVASVTLLLNAGYAADQIGALGTADLALSMLDEGTETRDALEVSDTLDRLGATLSATSDLDTSRVSMTLLTENLSESLDLFSEVVLSPAFPAQELERLRKQQIAAIQREKTRPVTMALRVLPELLYGEGHAYSMPLTGSGTEESVSGITVEDLREFHSTWFRPNNAVLIAVGDLTMEELMPHLEERFAGWQPGEIPEKELRKVAPREEPTVFLIDRPDSEQSIILAGQLAPPKSDPDELAVDAVHQILGGSFTARINMNLREDKHWSYGARTRLLDTAAQRPFYVSAPVQTDKTGESMAEILAELKGIRPEGGEPPTAEELERIQDKKILTLPGRWETNGAVLRDIVELERFELPADYWETFSGEVRALTLTNVSEQAEAIVRPDRLVWVVVGDRSEIEEGIQELGLGEIRYLDADGNPLGE